MDDDLDELPAPPRRSLPPEDRALLELAARAIGCVRFEEVEGEEYANLHFIDGAVMHAWNPLTFSGDALELAVSLRITPHIDGNLTDAESSIGFCTEAHLGNPIGATRRAITGAAAEIGKQQPE
jgi:hypothetical protein